MDTTNFVLFQNYITFVIIQDMLCIIINTILLIAIFLEDKRIKSLNNYETNSMTLVFLLQIIKEVCEIFAVSLEGNTDLIWLISLIYIIENLCDCISLIAFSIYEFEVLKKKAFISNATIYVVAFVCGFAFILQAMSYCYTHWFCYINEDGYFSYAPTYIICIGLYILVALFDWILAMSFKNELDNGEVNAWTLFMIFPLASMVANMINPSIELYNISICLSLLFVYVCIHARNTQKLAMQEKEISEASIRIMLSQIQPHFMYNSLNAIYYLIEKNPKLAKDAVDEFSKYLRENINALKTEDNIPIEAELSHVQSYLKLEKLRFDEQLNIKLDIQSTNFTIPSLTVQPLVENAVNHGLGQKEGGGTLTVRTYEQGGYFVVFIQDDGVGFNTAMLEEDKPASISLLHHSDEQKKESTHIGILNVKDRLKLMCDGELTIESTIGQGTTATIKIPKSYKI